jgi:hypothetical protein
MKLKFKNIFIRKEILHIKDIVTWWLNGIGYLNLFYLLYVIFHLLVIVTIFHNGWIFFLLPLIGIVGLIINIIFISGLLFEILFSKLFRFKINFDISAPTLEKILFIVSTTIVILLSIHNILDQ